MRPAVHENDDGVWYPDTDDMGVPETQAAIMRELAPSVQSWLLMQGRVARAGSDQFFYWVKGDITKTRAPDVYVIDGVPHDSGDVSVWKTWEGHHPAFVLEVCSSRWQKDYDDAVPAYDAMGVSEVVIFDPGASARARRRKQWQVFRRDETNRLVRVEAHHGDRVESVVLGCWIRHVSEHGDPRLRLATGWKGSTLLPTVEEALVRERAAREAAEREIAALREQIAKNKGR